MMVSVCLSHLNSAGWMASRPRPSCWTASRRRSTTCRRTTCSSSSPLTRGCAEVGGWGERGGGLRRPARRGPRSLAAEAALSRPLCASPCRAGVNSTLARQLKNLIPAIKKAKKDVQVGRSPASALFHPVMPRLTPPCCFICVLARPTSCSSWATRAVRSWPAPWPTSSRRSRPTPWPPTTSPWCVHPHTTSSLSTMTTRHGSSLRRTRRLLTTRGCDGFVVCGGGAGERPGPGHLQGQGRRCARGLQQV